jgi:hypothetical protein
MELRRNRRDRKAEEKQTKYGINKIEKYNPNETKFKNEI